MLKNFLIKIWESWGIERDDKILLHSSFKRTFKNIKNGTSIPKQRTLNRHCKDIVNSRHKKTPEVLNNGGF